MPTSGTFNFNPTFDEILQDAAGMVGGGPILADELLSAKRGLDILMTRIQNRNVLLHKIVTTTIPCSVGQGAYTLPASILDVHTINHRINNVELTLDRESFQTWSERTSKSSTGRPTTYWFDRGRDTGTINLWPVPSQAGDLVITAQRLTEDTLRAFDNVDVPRRFIPAITYGLAYWIGMRRPSVPADRLAALRAEFDAAVKEGMGEDRERASFFIKVAH